MMVFYLLFGFLLGACLGSFINVLANRTMQEKSLLGRSECDHCHKSLKWLDLIPVLSYLFLRGKCRYCHKSIPSELLWTEVAVGLICAYIFVSTTPDLNSPVSLFRLIFNLFVVIILSSLFITDLKTGYIPDKISITSSVIALISFVPIIYLTDDWWLLWNSLGVAVGLAGFFGLLILVTRGKGMGWGDVKYVFFLGLVLGLNAVVGVFLAFFLGAVIAIGLIVLSKKRFGQTIPFGPFLSIGGLIALLWGDQLIQWYSQLII